MKRNKTIALSLVCASLLGTAAISTSIASQPTNVEAATKRFKHGSKAYTTKNTIVYQNKKGKMTIYQVKGARIKIDDEIDKQINFYGKFTNYSNKPVSPQDFFDNHFETYQIKRNHRHPMDPTAYALNAPTSYTRFLFNQGQNEVLPHKSSRFAVSEEDPESFNEGQKIQVIATTDANFETNSKLSKIFCLPKVLTTKNHEKGHDKVRPEDIEIDSSATREYQFKHNKDATFKNGVYSSNRGQLTINNIKAIYYHYKSDMSLPKIKISIDADFLNKQKQSADALFFMYYYFSAYLLDKNGQKYNLDFNGDSDAILNKYSLAENAGKSIKHGRSTHFQATASTHVNEDSNEPLTLVIQGLGRSKKQIVGEYHVKFLPRTSEEGSKTIVY